MTGDGRDESVTFSLRELMKLEDDRIARERASQEARRLSEQAAKLEAERRVEEARAAKEKADAEERERARLREVEDVARREAMSRAAVEQTRIEVEARTRAEEAERERMHERELARLRAEQTPKVAIGPIVGSGFAGLALALVAAVGLYAGSLKPASDRQLAERDRAVVESTERASDLSRRADELGRVKEGLEAQLRDANREIASLKERPVKAPDSRGGIRGNGPALGGRGTRDTHGTGVKEGTAEPCLKGDPMCPNVGRP